MLLERLRKLMTPDEEETADATAAMLRQLVPICSLCGLTTTDHKYVKIGSAFQKPNIVEMFRIIKARELSKIRVLQEFDATKSAILVFAMAGHHHGGLLLDIKNPFELYEADEIYMTETLSAQEMAELTTQVPEDAWKKL